MVQQVTKGIKISITTNFEGNRYQNSLVYYVFSYSITIENQSKDSVQLTTRHWDIYDALNDMEVVDGEGVIGKKPVIRPGESYSYSSGCLLASPLGAMKGFYNMVNFSSTEKFRVYIPTFRLNAPFALN